MGSCYELTVEAPKPMSSLYELMEFFFVTHQQGSDFRAFLETHTFVLGLNYEEAFSLSQKCEKVVPLLPGGGFACSKRLNHAYF